MVGVAHMYGYFKGLFLVFYILIIIRCPIAYKISCHGIGEDSLTIKKQTNRKNCYKLIEYNINHIKDYIEVCLKINKQ